jgi:hypothetical protein
MKKIILLFLLLIPILQVKAQFRLSSSVVTAQLNLQSTYSKYNNSSSLNNAENKVFSNAGQLNLQFEKVYKENRMLGIGLVVNNVSFSKNYVNYLAGLSFSHRNIFPLKDKYGFNLQTNVSFLGGEYINSFFGPRNKSFQMQVGANINSGFYYFLNKNVVLGLNYNLVNFDYSSRTNNTNNSLLYRDSDYSNTDLSINISNSLSLSNFRLSVQYVFQAKK